MNDTLREGWLLGSHHPNGPTIAAGCYLLTLALLVLSVWQIVAMGREIGELKQMNLSQLSRLARMERTLERLEQSADQR